MLNLLRRFFWERKRRIFRYWDGRAMRTADPIVIRRSLVSDHEFKLIEDSSLIDNPCAPEKLADEAWQKCVGAVRRAFDGAGTLNEEECVDLFRAFCLYWEALKKNSNGSPIAPQSYPVTTSAGNSPDTKPCADSMPIPSEPASAMLAL